MRTIGIISDTHGLLRPEAVRALQGSDMILHAGDVGDPAILTELERIAPVHAVFGNTDSGEMRGRLPHHDVVPLGGTPRASSPPDGDQPGAAGPAPPLAYIVHIIEEVDLDPSGAGIQLVVTGHTHRPLIREVGGVTYLNPGSAGPRRFDLPVTVAHVRIGDDGRMDVGIEEILGRG